MKTGLKDTKISNNWEEKFDKQFDLYQGEYEDLISAPKVIIKQFISFLLEEQKNEILLKVRRHYDNPDILSFLEDELKD